MRTKPNQIETPEKSDSLTSLVMVGTLLQGRAAQAEDLKELHKILLNSEPSELEPLQTSEGATLLFRLLCPAERVVLAERHAELFHQVLLCLLTYMKEPSHAASIVKSLSEVQDIEFFADELVEGTSALGSPATPTGSRRQKRQSINGTDQILKKAATIAEIPCSPSTGEQDVERAKQTRRVSFLEILVSLFQLVTQEKHQSKPAHRHLIPALIRLFNAICRQPMGAETLLNELQRIERFHMKESIAASSPSVSRRNNSEETKRQGAIRTSFLRPLIDPLRPTDSPFEVGGHFEEHLNLCDVGWILEPVELSSSWTTVHRAPFRGGEPRLAAWCTPSSLGMSSHIALISLSCCEERNAAHRGSRRGRAT